MFLYLVIICVAKFFLIIEDYTKQQFPVFNHTMELKYSPERTGSSNCHFDHYTAVVGQFMLYYFL